MNAIENLAVFAPLVLVAAIIEVSTKATVLSAQIYVAARLAHYVIYTAGIPVVRTLAFLIGACATLVICDRAASQRNLDRDPRSGFAVSEV
jgi:uncharacterized MAPEG superfamily protein